MKKKSAIVLKILFKYFGGFKTLRNFATAKGNQQRPFRNRKLKFASLAQLARARDL